MLYYAVVLNVLCECVYTFKCLVSRTARVHCINKVWPIKSLERKSAVGTGFIDVYL